MLKKLIKAYAQLVESGEAVTLDNLSDTFKEEKTIDFFSFAETNVLAPIKQKSKLGTFRRYDAVLNKFKSYTKGAFNSSIWAVAHS